MPDNSVPPSQKSSSRFLLFPPPPSLLEDENLPGSIPTKDKTEGSVVITKKSDETGTFTTLATLEEELSDKGEESATEHDQEHFNGRGSIDGVGVTYHMRRRMKKQMELVVQTKYVVSPEELEGVAVNGPAVDADLAADEKRNSSRIRTSKTVSTISHVNNNKLEQMLGKELGLQDNLSKKSYFTSQKPWGIIGVESEFKAYWDWLIIGLVVYNTFSIPYQMAFEVDNRLVWVVAVDIVVIALFCVDILLSFRTGFEDKFGFHVHVPKKIAMRYLTSWFLIDLMGTVPWDYIGAAVAPEDRAMIGLLQLLKTPRLLKLSRLMKKFDSLKSAANALRIFKLIFGFFLIAHVTGCIWYAIGKDGWREAYEVSDSDQNMYLASLYWALTTLTTTGYGDITPITVHEQTITAFVLVLGSVIYATIFGNVSLLIQSFDAQEARYRVKLARVTDLIRYYKVSDALAQRIRDYTEYFRSVSGSSDMISTLQDFPKQLRGEVAMSLYEDIISKAPILGHSNRNFLRDIAIHLRPQACLPGEFVFKAGDAGTEMYFVGNGNLQVISADGKVVYITLGYGALVGEEALFFASRRNAGLMAISPCTLYVIARHEFKAVLSEYPEEYERMKKLATERRNKNKANRHMMEKIKQKKLENPTSSNKGSSISPPNNVSLSLQKGSTGLWSNSSLSKGAKKVSEASSGQTEAPLQELVSSVDSLHVRMTKIEIMLEKLVALQS